MRWRRFSLTHLVSSFSAPVSHTHLGSSFSAPVSHTHLVSSFNAPVSHTHLVSSFNAPVSHTHLVSSITLTCVLCCTSLQTHTHSQPDRSPHDARLPSDYPPSALALLTRPLWTSPPHLWHGRPPKPSVPDHENSLGFSCVASAFSSVAARRSTGRVSPRERT